MMKRSTRGVVLLVCGACLVSNSEPSRATAGARLSGWTLTLDGLPLSGVEIVLACPPAPPKRTLSEERGHFELANVPAGNCRLWGTKPGYVDANVDGDPGVRGPYSLTIHEDVWRDGFELRLARGGVLTGRITNYRGGESRNVRVHPLRREVINGMTKLVGMPYRPVSPSGSFEFTALPPGDYYVAASPVPEGSDAGGASGYAMTYFPGTTKLTDAQSFTLKPGESRRIDFELASTRSFTVSGIAYDSAGKPLPYASVGLSVETEPQWIAGNTQTRGDGTFALTGVPSGRYLLHVSQKLIELGEVHFDVDEADVRNLVVRVGPRR